MSKRCFVCNEVFAGLGGHMRVHAEPKIREALIRELQEVTDELGRFPTSVELETDLENRPSNTTYQKYFGSFADAARAAGFEPHSQSYDKVSSEEMVDEVTRIGDKLGKVPTERDINEFGNYSAGAIIRRFGSWSATLREAGFDIPADRKIVVSDDKLLEHLEQVAEKLERAPTAKEFRDEGSYGVATYVRRFGSWIDALALVGYPISPHRGKGFPPGKEHPDWEGGTGINYGKGWTKRKRRKVRERDEYQCVRCGMTHETHLQEYGCTLHVHHIIPAREIDDSAQRNSMDNLVTLCQSCHTTTERFPVTPEFPNAVSKSN